MKKHDIILNVDPGCLAKDTEITLIKDKQNFSFKSLLDLGLVDSVLRVVEFLPDGLKFLKPADLTIRFEKILNSDSELFIFHGSYNNNWQRTVWELVPNGIEENIVEGVVNVKINSFCFFSYIFAKRGQLARILSHLNHSFTCRAYVFYRRLFSMDTIDISVVLLSEFVDEKEEEDIRQLKDHFEAGYVKGEKGMLKRVHTDRPLEMCVDFPGVESAPFSFEIDKSQLDSVGFVIDHVKGIPVKSPASGTVKISNYAAILWKLTIHEMKLEKAYGNLKFLFLFCMKHVIFCCFKFIIYSTVLQYMATIVSALTKNESPYQKVTGRRRETDVFYRCPKSEGNVFRPITRFLRQQN